jgi:hypothetical protein
MTPICQVCIRVCLSILLFSVSILHAIEEDSYPIENERLTKYYGSIGSQDCNSFDIAWFVNNKKDQALVIWLHTDYHKIRSLHFNPGDIPDLVLKYIDLHYRNTENSGLWKPLPLLEKRRCMEHFLENAESIPSRYFVTVQGFTLGMYSQDAIEHYGSPHSVETTPEDKIFSWEYAADPSLAGRQPEEGKAYAKNSFGYHIKILFENDKAVAIVMASLSP